MSEYRITIAAAELGRPEVAEANAERLLAVLERKYPELGPAVGANLELGWLEATFSIEADEHRKAIEEGGGIFGWGIWAAELEPTDVTHMELELVDAPEPVEA